MEEKNFDSTTEVKSNDDGVNYIVDLTERTTQYCSMIANTEEEKISLYNAMNNPEKRLGDCINSIINVKDAFVEVVNCTNKETGEVTQCPRIVLIDDKGVGYQCVSIGIFSAIKKIFGVFGEPNTWKAPKAVKVQQITKGTKKMLTLNVVKK